MYNTLLDGRVQIGAAEDKMTSVTTDVDAMTKNFKEMKKLFTDVI